MQQNPIDLMAFQKKFATERACRQHLFRFRWPDWYTCPRCGHHSYVFPQHEASLSMQIMSVSGLFDSWNGFSQDENPPQKMVLDDLPHGSAKKWHLHAVCATHVEHQKLQDGVGDGS